MGRHMNIISLTETRRITIRMSDFAACLALREIAGLARLEGAPPYFVFCNPERELVGVRSIAAPDGTKLVFMDAPTLCVLLMRIFGWLGIPVPRRAGKRVEFAIDSLSLVLGLDIQKPLKTNAAQTVTQVLW
jgi:hypothetical protein